jgi:hypothetical protein
MITPPVRLRHVLNRSTHTTNTTNPATLECGGKRSATPLSLGGFGGGGEPKRRRRCALPAQSLFLIALLVLTGCSEVRNTKSTCSFPLRDNLLFTNDGIPAGWTVRAWNDVSKPGPTEALWRVEGGTLIGGAERGSWLMSEWELGDFELEFDFKLGPMGNSGCALRAPMAGDPAFDGMELQMADYRYNTNAKPSELTGGIYRAIAPIKQVYKPTEWNHYRITLRGPHLVAVLNGEKIQDIDLSLQSPEVKRHDGTPAVPVKDRPRRGHIGFQNLSRGTDPVLIRSARLRVLE